MTDGLDERLAALSAAVEIADGRLDEEAVEPARRVVRRAGERLGLGLEATVAALAGPTGAGKSTLFNALAGAELVPASRRRPTTSAATAAIWGESPDALLDWLEVPLRHPASEGQHDGLVLLDLPDFDSVEESHRLEVDRLIDLVDLMVWVVDPQKYADAALHDRYLRRLGAHDGSMAVVLNQSDLLAPDALRECRGDLARLLAANDLSRVRVLTVSALTGDGLSDLSDLLEERVRERDAALARLSADVESTLPALSRYCAGSSAGEVRGRDRERMVATLGEAAGVPAVVRAAERAHRRRGALAAGWPPLRWISRVRPDPLARLRLGDRPQEETHTSLPAPTPVQRSQAASAIRTLAGSAGAELPDPWPALVRTAATAGEDELGDRLDRAVAGADLAMRRPLWWRPAGVLQTLLVITALAGALWLVGLAVLGYLRLDDVVPTPRVWAIPLPSLALVGGAALGLTLAALARVVNGIAARRRARAAERSLRRRIDGVAAHLVVEPVETELRAYNDLCASLGRAADTGGRRWGRRRDQRPAAPVAP